MSAAAPCGHNINYSTFRKRKTQCEHMQAKIKFNVLVSGIYSACLHGYTCSEM